MRHAVIFVGMCLLATGIVYSAAETDTFTDAQKSFWSLQPVKKPAVPTVKARQLVNNPLDAFVLAKLEEKQLEPNKPADRITLLRRVTIDGLTTQTYANTKASHDIVAVSGDTMAYLDYGETDCNSIFEINNAGTVKEVFESTNVTSTGTGMNNCHGNAVRYSKKEDFYTYSDWQKELAVVSRAGALQWKLSQKVSGGSAAWGGVQHGHQLLDSSIILFGNNGTAGGNKSQAFEFGLDGKLIKAFKSGGGATNFGDVQRLANGNTIVTYSTSSLIQVVDASDAVVLEIKGSGSFGYLEFRDSLYGPPLDIQ